MHIRTTEQLLFLMQKNLQTTLKFRYSAKATKIWKNLNNIFNLQSNIQWNWVIFFQIFVAFSGYPNFIKVNWIGSMTKMTSLKKFLIKTQVHEHKNTYDPFHQSMWLHDCSRFWNKYFELSYLKHLNTFWSQE